MNHHSYRILLGAIGFLSVLGNNRMNRKDAHRELRGKSVDKTAEMSIFIRSAGIREDSWQTSEDGKTITYLEL